ncbi:shikimate kinase [Paenibacillus sp. CFBP13512]|uniref:shikimate kinase n=1 Tax=Paenibacillus sp. CFBP13512 TaxID=2184007 RepID=UPI0010C0F39A|nr:shikimate kinase [Paenibacillus sp. CFBP13512]TKJ90695.1 shikimate kinase [Paenibacillus sp. CFBP13512]
MKFIILFGPQAVGKMTVGQSLVAKTNFKLFHNHMSIDLQSDWDYIENISDLFRSRGAEVYYVELEADLEERKVRNKTENRLIHKPTKRNTEWSENELIETNTLYRLNSLPDEIQKQHYLRINNTHLSADTVADMIIEKFKLK